MSNKNRLLLYQNRYYCRIEICCDDQHYDDSICYVMKLLCSVAQGKNVFVEYCGDNPELEDSDNVIAQRNDTKYVLGKKLWMREKWLNATDKSFVEDRYTMVYIFNSDYLWDSFLECATGKLSNIKKIPQLQLIATFGECENTVLYIKSENSVITEILEHFKSKGFKVKHGIS